MASETESLHEYFAAISEDLAQIIRLHDSELDKRTIDALQAESFPEGLALVSGDAALELAVQNMTAAVLDLSPAVLNDLAADYAAIYLNHRYQVSPIESIWLSDDHLACAFPFFELQGIYKAAGLKTANWRQRFDDHLVMQLDYLRQRLLSPTENEALLAKHLGVFIDEHLGHWFADFACCVSQRCQTDFYAALQELTLAWLQSFRQLLCEWGAEPPLTKDAVQQRVDKKNAASKAAQSPACYAPVGQGV